MEANKVTRKMGEAGSDVSGIFLQELVPALILNIYMKKWEGGLVNISNIVRLNLVFLSKLIV